MKRILLLILLIASLVVSSCANPNKGYIASLRATNDSVVFLAQKAKMMCGAGQLSENDCVKIKTIYGEIKKADDAVIDITQAAIIAGTEVSTLPSYAVAMDKLASAMNNLFALLLELKVMGGSK